MTSPAQVTILGYGKIARDAHGPAWQRATASGRAVVRAIFEPTSSGCAAAAAAFPQAEIIRTDARHAFDAKRFGDVVDICTPGELHHELVIAALAQGSHVLVEKPLAHSAAEVEEIVATQDGAIVQVCQTMRFAKPVQQFKAAVDAGRVGQVSRVQVLHHARHILSEAEWVTRSRPDGAIFENAIHFLDLVHYLLDLDVPLSIDAVRFHEVQHRPVVTGFELLASDVTGRQVSIDFLQDSLVHSALLSRTYVSATGADAELRFYPDGFRLLSGVVDPLQDVRADVARLGGLVRRLVRPNASPSPHDVLIGHLLDARSGQTPPLCTPASVQPAVTQAHELSQRWISGTNG